MARFLIFCFTLVCVSCGPDAAKDAPTLSVKEQVVILPDSDRETLPVSVYVAQPMADISKLVLFSHGAFSEPKKYEALLSAWALAGYGVLAPLHVDSESWTGPRPENSQDGVAWRLRDMRRILEQLAEIEAQVGTRFEVDEIMATGHSFGGLIAQIQAGAKPGPVAGDVVPGSSIPVAGIIALSPPGPVPNYIDAQGWAQMTAPQLLVTGDGDVVPMMAPEWQAHLAAHWATPAPSYALVLEGVDHYFGNVIGRTEYPGPPQSEQFDVALGYSIEFLDAVLTDDAPAAEIFEAAQQSSSPVLGLSRAP